MVSIRTLVYVANARLPTEKAHGYQICKMCEAFARHGTRVSLFYPARRQRNPALQNEDVFNYYSIPRLFETRILANLDVIGLARFIPDRLFRVVFCLHSLLWGLYASLKVNHPRADFYFTRDIAVAYWLVRRGLPTVYEAHTVPQKAQRLLLRSMFKSQSLKAVVALTAFTKNQLVPMGLSEDRVVVLASGVDLSLFQNLPNRDRCRVHFGLPRNKKIIGYIGRFETLGMEKGITHLVKSMSCLSQEVGRSSMLLCIGGPMSRVSSYLSVAKEYGVPSERIRFVDRVSNAEVPLWIRACDVVTTPWPWTEHFAFSASPLKLFEYMASGVPIVSTDLPSHREVLRHGENALLVTPGNPNAFALALQRVLENSYEAQRLASQALRDVERYSWQQRAARVIDFLTPTQT